MRRVTAALTFPVHGCPCLSLAMSELYSFEMCHIRKMQKKSVLKH